MSCSVSAVDVADHPGASPSGVSSADDSSTSGSEFSGNAVTGDGVPSRMGTAVAEAPRVEVPPGYPEPAQAIPGETADELFNRLILPEMEVMWRVALSITRNAADAEDVVQESLLRAYRAIETFDGRYPRAWLLTILRNTERNRHRRRRPELLSDPEIAEERGPATESDAVERYAEDREFDDAVAQSLLKLPENFRQIIELVDIDGLSYQEAADLLDVPLGTVMSRLHRARRRIRDMLIPLGYGPPSHGHNSRGHADGSGHHTGRSDEPSHSKQPGTGSTHTSGDES